MCSGRWIFCGGELLNLQHGKQRHDPIKPPSLQLFCDGGGEEGGFLPRRDFPQAGRKQAHFSSLQLMPPLAGDGLGWLNQKAIGVASSKKQVALSKKQDHSLLLLLLQPHLVVIMTCSGRRASIMQARRDVIRKLSNPWAARVFATSLEESFSHIRVAYGLHQLNWEQDFV